MIRSFKDRDAEWIFNRRRSRRYAGLEQVIYRKLLAVHAAQAVAELAAPLGNRLEALRGDRKGQYSIRINDQFRICFRWEDSYADQVEIADYH